MSKDKIDHTGYQLDRKTLQIDAGMGGNMVVDKVFEGLNGLDMNHNQKSDVAEIAPFIIKAAPICLAMYPKVKALAAYIKVDAIIAWFKSHTEFFTDLKAAEVHLAELAPHLDQLAAIGTEVAKLAPKA